MLQSLRAVVPSQNSRMLAIVDGYSLRLNMGVAAAGVHGTGSRNSGKGQDVLMEEGQWRPGLTVRAEKGGCPGGRSLPQHGPIRHPGIF